MLHEAVEHILQQRIAGDLLANLALRGQLAHPVGDVSQVRHRRGTVTLEDVGIEVLRPAAADRPDEVLKNIFPAAKTLNHLTIVVVDLTRPDQRIASFTVGTDVGSTTAESRGLIGPLGL